MMPIILAKEEWNGSFGPYAGPVKVQYALWHEYRRPGCVREELKGRCEGRMRGEAKGTRMGHDRGNVRRKKCSEKADEV